MPSICPVMCEDLYTDSNHYSSYSDCKSFKEGIDEQWPIVQTKWEGKSSQGIGRGKEG